MCIGMYWDRGQGEQVCCRIGYAFENCYTGLPVITTIAQFAFRSAHTEGNWLGRNARRDALARLLAITGISIQFSVGITTPEAG